MASDSHRCKTCYSNASSVGGKHCDECYKWAHDNLNKYFKEYPSTEAYPESYKLYEWIATHFFPDTLKVANIIKHGPPPSTHNRR